MLNLQESSTSPQTTSPMRLLKELDLPLQAMTSLLSLPELLTAPDGDAHPVMLLPGYGADDASLSPLLCFVQLLGYQADTWGLGENDGEVDTLVQAVARLVARNAATAGQAISLIGWSLGGIVAREVARLQPHDVRQVITLGSPIVGGAKYTALAALLEDNDEELNELEKEIGRRNQQGLRVPVTSIYSRTDGVVPWQISIDSFNPHADNIEVVSTHIGLASHPRVLRIIAEQLARPQTQGATS